MKQKNMAVFRHVSEILYLALCASFEQIVHKKINQTSNVEKQQLHE